VNGTAGFDRLLAAGIVPPLLVGLLTAGVAFLLHEIAHKVVAVHYDQVAEFRADNSMLFLAVMSSLLGFIFAAPGAVHHRGRLTPREHGHIALAGPVVNLLLTLVFLPALLLGPVVGSPVITLIGSRGIAINVFLAAFNLIPYGPSTGRPCSTGARVWGRLLRPLRRAHDRARVRRRTRLRRAVLSRASPAPAGPRSSPSTRSRGTVRFCSAGVPRHMTEGDGGETGGGDEEPTIDGDDELTYADAGVDIDASEAATAALIGAVGEGRATTPACSTSATATSRWRPTGRDEAARRRGA